MHKYYRRELLVLQNFLCFQNTVLFSLCVSLRRQTLSQQSGCPIKMELPVYPPRQKNVAAE